MNILTIIILLGAHLVGDFLLQSRQIARDKSSKLSALAEHIMILAATYSIGLGLLGMFDPGMDGFDGVTFLGINLISHALIDWYVWRGYKLSVLLRHTEGPGSLAERANRVAWGRFRYYEDQWFYWTIGLDQFLHTSILIGSYVWLIR